VRTSNDDDLRLEFFLALDPKAVTLSDFNEVLLALNPKLELEFTDEDLFLSEFVDEDLFLSELILH